MMPIPTPTITTSSSGGRCDPGHSNPALDILDTGYLTTDKAGAPAVSVFDAGYITTQRAGDPGYDAQTQLGVNPKRYINVNGETVVAQTGAVHAPVHAPVQHGLRNESALELSDVTMGTV